MERTLWTDERVNDMVDRLDRRMDQLDRRMDSFQQEMREMRVEMREMRTEMHIEFQTIRRDMLHGAIALLVTQTGLFVTLLIHGS